MRRNQKGIVSLLFILFMAVVASFVLTVGYSRILLALQRGKGVGDSLITSYASETQINDLLSRLIQGYLGEGDFPFSESFEMGDGTRVTVRGEILGNDQILSVVSKRDFAVSEVRAVRAVSVEESVDKVDIVFVLDCTKSMNEGSGIGTSRFTELERAVVGFLDGASVYSFAESNLRVGVVVFGIDAAWLRTADGLEVRPNANLSLAEVRQAVEGGFGSTQDESPVCGSLELPDWTSIGSGIVFAHNYFSEYAAEGVKGVEIVVTDGDPNTRIPYDNCPIVGGLSGSGFCPWPRDYCSSNPFDWECSGWEGRCQGPARAFLACSLAREDVVWGLRWDRDDYGVRDSDVDIYSLTIYDSPNSEVVGIFNDFSTRYYQLANAAELSGALEEILGRVVESMSVIRITRVIPVADE